MLIAVLFAAAFNLLSGQGGMLSFGHAAYFGIGTFATVHAMNAFGGNGLLPTPLLPLAGGAMGLLAGGGRLVRHPARGRLLRHDHAGPAELLHALAPHRRLVRRRGGHLHHAHAGLASASATARRSTT